jgi:hypothetical protein
VTRCADGNRQVGTFPNSCFCSSRSAPSRGALPREEARRSLEDRLLQLAVLVRQLVDLRGFAASHQPLCSRPISAWTFWHVPLPAPFTEVMALLDGRERYCPGHLDRAVIAEFIDGCGRPGCDALLAHTAGSTARVLARSGRSGRTFLARRSGRGAREALSSAAGGRPRAGRSHGGAACELVRSFLGQGLAGRGAGSLSQSSGSTARGVMQPLQSCP